jgi:hypothetical protein
MIAEVIKLAASLAAIGALFWLARFLQLGGEPRIRDEDHARQLAHDGIYGFAGTDAVLDMGGYSALVRDAGGRHVLVWLLGNRFVTRMLSRDVQARLDQRLLMIDPAEPGTGPIILNLGEPAQYWAAGLRHIPDA